MGTGSRRFGKMKKLKFKRNEREANVDEDKNNQSIDSEGTVVLIQEASRKIETDLAVVALDKFEINGFYSKDSDDGKARNENRECIVTTNINGQDSVLHLTTDGSGAVEFSEKFHNRILYFGKHEHNIDFDVKLVETDKDTIANLKKAQGAMTIAGSVANFVPGFGSMASSGFNLIGAIMGFASTLIDDDLELHFLGSIGDLGESDDDDYLPLNGGRYEIARRNLKDPEKKDISIYFSIYRYKHLSEKKDRHVIIVLKSIDLKLNEGDKEENLLFEANLGSGKDAQVFNFDTKLENGKAIIENVMGLRNKTLYKGKWNIGVPFLFTLSLIKDITEELKALKGVIAAAGKTAAEVSAFKAARDALQAAAELDLKGAAAARAKGAITKALIENATKASESARSVYLELMGKEVKTGKLTGFITEVSSVEETKLAKAHNFITVSSAAPLGSTPKWEEHKLNLKISGGGEAILTLGVMAREIEKKPKEE